MCTIHYHSIDSCTMLIDKKEISKGSIILQEKPFVYVLSSKFRTERCDFCFSKGELLKCSVCRYVYYCGRACQKEGWSIHKLECRNLMKIHPRILPDAGRMLARLIRILGHGGNELKSYYTKKDYRKFKDLMSHYSDIKNDQNRMEHFSSLYGVLSEFFNGEILPNSAELLGMYCRMCVNSFSIGNQEFQSVGTGLYLGASVVDHSCKPNAVVTFEGTTLIMRVLENITSLDWTKIFISYIDVMAVKKERQAELESTYYFLCQCPKCLGPEPITEMTGAACPNRNCDNCLDSTSMKDGQKCAKCGETITEEFINTFRDVMEMTIIHLKNMNETIYLDVCEVCLRKQEGVLYKYNVKHVKMLDLVFDSSIEFGKFDEALKYGLELIIGLYEYYGKMHPMTGLLHLKLAKLLLYQDERKQALDHLRKAKEILEITHGLKSSLFKEHLIPLLTQASIEYSR
ncbi:SET and MYND domain containing, class 3 isoform X3 [Leptinotarsa decemlineata]|uniref:SET and MYND domain containing, class 3 isoform X3 n=1 Tax=Leptinotarsa decemlineata TaxID=7539 RepID=UPI003D30661C